MINHASTCKERAFTNKYFLLLIIGVTSQPKINYFYLRW